MLTYQGRRDLFGDLANTSASTTLTLADKLMNNAERQLISTRDWDFLERQYTLQTVSDTFTVTIASPGVFSLTGHGFFPGQVLYFTTTGALPTGLSSGVEYYVVTAGLTADAFEVSTQINGTAVNTSGSQSGTHTVKTQTFILPPYTRKPESVYVRVSTTRYPLKEVSTRVEWDRLNQTVYHSDTSTHYFIYDGTLQVYPLPTTDANVITINARRVHRDLSIADYTTGTIDVITKNSTAVTGSSTVWTSPMIGRFLRITQSNTAAASGDGAWYEIAQRTSDTAIVLRKAYGGTSLTTGAAGAYIIGEVGLLPEDHQILPVYEALRTYFTSVDPNTSKAQLYKGMADENKAQMFRDYGAKVDVALDEGMYEEEIENPNHFVSL